MQLFYTESEGGPWKRWPHKQHPNLIILEMHKRAQRSVVEKEIKIHALAGFHGDSSKNKFAFRWDCRNGWTLHPFSTNEK